MLAVSRYGLGEKERRRRMAWERIDQLARRVIRQLELGMADEAGEEDSTPPATDAPQAEGSHVAKEMEKGRGRSRASQARTDKKINRPGGAFTGLSTAFAAREASPAPVVLSPLDVIECRGFIAPVPGNGRTTGNSPERYELLGQGSAGGQPRPPARPPQLELVRAHALVNLAETG
jgi:hypothetical protein